METAVVSCFGALPGRTEGRVRSLLCGQQQRTPGGSRTPRFLPPLPVPGPLFRLLLPFLSQFVVDASNPTQLSASCVQLLGLLSAEPLAGAAVLLLFNKTDLPCYMTVEEMKSLIRLPDIIACAKQNITVVEVSARTGTGLTGVLRWLQDTHRTSR
ncbi:ADP ribosylation factor like GTPase 16 [Phyllostomus discolor]|uniref:ADP ribosylation factor like GTPase 16 n=1 Tax=Phyllostomus discolor TaxID=89673 RepID=A0A833ZGN8_9CHIR|nr:ADP ribosylation factor like GTPase 16 [Phyllostomus discolor]